MTYRAFVIIFASFLLFLGQCGYSNGQCELPECEDSDLGTDAFLKRMPEAGQTGCYSNDSVVTLTCEYGNLIDGSPQDNTCNNGTWNNGVADCTDYCMFESDDENVMWDPKQPGYNVNDTLAFSCEDGYKLTSDPPTSFRCLDGGLWNKTNLDPACVVFNCSTPSITDENIMLDPDTEIYNGDQTITYLCPDGFTVKGSETNKCVDQDEWESAHPTCMSSGNVIQAFWYLLTVTTSYTLLSFYM